MQSCEAPTLQFAPWPAPPRSTRSPNASSACSCATRNCSAPTRCCGAGGALTRERDSLQVAAGRGARAASMRCSSACPTRTRRQTHHADEANRSPDHGPELPARLPRRRRGAPAAKRWRSVDAAMCKIRDAGKVKARDRIAVLAALNLAFDLARPRSADRRARARRRRGDASRRCRRPTPAPALIAAPGPGAGRRRPAALSRSSPAVSRRRVIRSRWSRRAAPASRPKMSSSAVRAGLYISLNQCSSSRAWNIAWRA